MSARPRQAYLHLPAMFHWSPTEHRRSITRHGLRPTTPSGLVDETDETSDVRLMVCMSPTPHTAWDYSAGVVGEKGQSWDLWQIALADDDEVHVRPHFGPYVVEVRVANRIPKSRLWLVGTREV